MTTTTNIQFTQNGISYQGRPMGENTHSGASIYYVQKYSTKTGKLLSQWRMALQASDGRFVFSGKWQSSFNGGAK